MGECPAQSLKARRERHSSRSCSLQFRFAPQEHSIQIARLIGVCQQIQFGKHPEFRDFLPDITECGKVFDSEAYTVEERDLGVVSAAVCLTGLPEQFPEARVPEVRKALTEVAVGVESDARQFLGSVMHVAIGANG